MAAEPLILTGQHVRLEPLTHAHAGALVTASTADPDLYRWSPVPQTPEQARAYIDLALAWQAAGTAIPFATVCLSDGAVLGSTRFWNIERWAWPPAHPRHARPHPDACEIGYSWLTRDAIRTPANTEAKLLMLTHAFESWEVLRVCLHTDMRNQRSRTAIERIGGRFEGTLRAHRMAADFTPRDSARYSILAAEWPEAKERLQALSQARTA
jgi:RimJ/RimL family protein N-acetyltransferase